MAERPYLSIGEVLALLKDEFSDVTISKIRFLESQGLIDPERTPSGYRKFYEAEVERLRWILRQQKEHYLPLRVIKGKLSESGTPAEGDDGDENDEHEERVADHRAVPVERVDGVDRVGLRTGEVGRSDPLGAAPRPTSGRPARPAGDPARRPPPPFPESLRRGREARSTPAAFLTAPAEAVSLPAPPEPVAPAPKAFAPHEVELTGEELAAQCGVTVVLIAELESYGLVKGVNGPGGRYYDGHAVEVVRLAADFGRYGVEPRHLKQWKSAAERQADVIEQVVAPLRRQRNPEARRQAAEAVSEMAVMALELHRAFLRGAVSKLT